MTEKFTICNMGLNGGFIKENGKIIEIERVVDLLNEQHEQIERLKENFRVLDEVKCELADENEELKKENDMLSCELSVSTNKEISRNCRIAELEEENEHYKSIFFELVETALTDKHSRELYCKGILDIFDKTNSLNQAREMIKEHLE